MEPNQKSNAPQLNKWTFVSLASQLAFIIALPLFIFGLVGKWLDNELGTKPWITLGGVLIAIAATTAWLTFRFKAMLK